MADLPAGWTSCAFSEIVEVLESGSRPRGGVRGTTEGTPSLGGEHLTCDGGFEFSKLKYVPSDFAQRMSKGHIETGDVLIVKDGATTGKTAFVTEDFPYADAVVNEHVFLCRLFPELDAEFFFRFLMSKEGQNRILDNFQGSAQGGINQSFAPNTEVPLAPFPEQKRIVEKLQKLLPRVDSCQERLDKIPAILKRFRQSVLAAACSGKLTEDWRTQQSGLTPWREAPLSELAELITKGSSPKWQGIQYVDDGVLFVTSENVRSGYLDLTAKKYVESRFNEIQKRSQLRNGDLLTNIVGASIGRSCLFEFDDCANINQAVCLVRLKNVMVPKFVLFVLNAPFLVDSMHKSKVDVARANLSLKDVGNFQIPVPPLEEQREIVRRVNALFQMANAVGKRYEAGKAAVDKLTQSVLAKAFRGELVPQNPDEEPASVLLEKIKEKRDNADSTKKKRSKPRKRQD